MIFILNKIWPLFSLSFVERKTGVKPAFLGISSHCILLLQWCLNHIFFYCNIPFVFGVDQCSSWGQRKPERKWTIIVGCRYSELVRTGNNLMNWHDNLTIPNLILQHISSNEMGSNLEFVLKLRIKLHRRSSCLPLCLTLCLTLQLLLNFLKYNFFFIHKRTPSWE